MMNNQDIIRVIPAEHPITTDFFRMSTELGYTFIA